MTAERWQQIARIYDAAADLADDDRTRYLAEACGGDADLRREVESLLADSHARLLIDTPVWESAAGLLEPAAELPPGRMLGPYRIEALLGSGGMGLVYRAYDTRLNRTVAVKVIADELAAATAFRERFEREARVLAALRHPHICTLYDVGRDDGMAFLVMEYVEGETLAALLTRARRQMAGIEGGRTLPRWRSDGRELFYIAPDDSLIAVPIAVSESSVQVGRAHPLFKTRRKVMSTRFGYSYDVAPDGRRVLINTSPAPRPPSPLTVVMHWTPGW